MRGDCFAYAEVGKLVALLDQAGFGNVAVQDWHQKLSIDGGTPAAEAADFELASFSTFGELLAGAGDLALQSARQALTSHQQEGVVRMDAAAYFVTYAAIRYGEGTIEAQYLKRRNSGAGDGVQTHDVQLGKSTMN